MTAPERNKPIEWQQGEWRFGDRPQDVDAWLAKPDTLHIMVDFRSPDTPPGHWHRVMTVTKAWLDARAKGTQAGIWPAILIVRDGERAAIEAGITAELDNGAWHLLTSYAVVVPADYPDSDW